MNDALTAALRTAAARLTERQIHGAIKVRRVTNGGRVVGVVTVRIVDGTAQDERFAVACIYSAAESAHVAVNVSLAA